MSKTTYRQWQVTRVKIHYDSSGWKTYTIYDPEFGAREFAEDTLQLKVGDEICARLNFKGINNLGEYLVEIQT